VSFNSSEKSNSMIPPAVEVAEKLSTVPSLSRS
jgi:hypothetical protein